jgi:hypothetical protein
VPENATIFTKTQAGVETTPGTSVAANKLFTAMGFTPSPEFEIDRFRPSGFKYETLAAETYEQMTFDIGGRQTYTELIYLLSSLITKPTPTTPSGGTTSKAWTFESNAIDVDAPATYTIEFGSSVRAHKFTNGIVNEGQFTWAKTAAPEVSGSGFGRSMTDSITLTAAPTALALVPVLPTQIDAFKETSGTNVSATTPANRILRDFSMSWSLSGRYSPVRVLNSANPSFETQVESEPELGMELQVAVDTEGMGFLTDLRAGTRSFIAMKALGGIAEGTVNYGFRVNTAVSVVDSDGFDDNDGARVVTWSLGGQYDATWTKAFSIIVTNLLATL